MTGNEVQRRRSTAPARSARCRRLLTAVAGCSLCCASAALAQNADRFAADRSPVAAASPRAEQLVTGIGDADGEVIVGAGCSKLLHARGSIYRTLVADERVTRLVQVSPDELSIIGAGEGSTSATIWIEGEERPLALIVRVVLSPEPSRPAIAPTDPSDTDSLEARLEQIYPGHRIEIVRIHDKAIVMGDARTQQEANEIISIIRSALDSTSAASPAPTVAVRPGVTANRAAELPTSSGAAAGYQVINKLRVSNIPQLFRLRLSDPAPGRAVTSGDNGAATLHGADKVVAASARGGAEPSDLCPACAAQQAGAAVPESRAGGSPFAGSGQELLLVVTPVNDAASRTLVDSLRDENAGTGPYELTIESRSRGAAASPVLRGTIVPLSESRLRDYLDAERHYLPGPSGHSDLASSNRLDTAAADDVSVVPAGSDAARADPRPPASPLHLYGHSTVMQQAEATSSAGGSAEPTAQRSERPPVATPAYALPDGSRPYESRGAIAKPAEKRLGYRPPF
jgi:hypothetical protein